MKFGLPLVAGMIAVGVISTTAIGGSHVDKAAMAAVKARQSHMQLYAFNIGLLGGMAKGAIEYDAQAASGAAANLAALSKLDQSRYWMPGTDMEALGADTTEALPALWQADSTARDIGMSLAQAAGEMEAVAGNGLEALQGAIGGVGKACGSCHEKYRKDDT